MEVAHDTDQVHHIMTKKERIELEKMLTLVGEYSDKLLSLREGAEESYKEWFESDPEAPTLGDGGYYKLGFVAQGCKDYALIIKNAVRRFSEEVKP